MTITELRHQLWKMLKMVRFIFNIRLSISISLVYKFVSAIIKTCIHTHQRTIRAKPLEIFLTKSQKKISQYMFDLHTYLIYTSCHAKMSQLKRIISGKSLSSPALVHTKSMLLYHRITGHEGSQKTSYNCQKGRASAEEMPP